MEDEKEGSNPTSNSKDGGDCDYELLTKIITNDTNPKKSTLHIHCRHISTRTVFEDYFTPNQLQKAGFAGIRSYKQLDKAKNLMDTAFVTSDKEISLDMQIIDKHLIGKFMEANDSDDEEEEDELNQHKDDNDNEDDAKEEQLKSTKEDLKNKVLAIHLIKEDHFMLLECKLILAQVPRQETEVLKEIIEEMKHRLMPIGSIVMWSGDIKNIPPGWALCDGTNNTPDLRDRFIVGSGGNYKNGDIGGKAEHKHQITVAPHALTKEQMPSHNHSYTYYIYGTSSNYNGSSSSYSLVSNNSSTGYTQTVGGGQAHVHGSSCGNASNVPPYYAMCFIMLQDPPKYSI